MKQILVSHPKGGADLETIARIVRGTTAIDEVSYVGYDVPNTNPILGSCSRYEKKISPYQPGFTTFVEIRYALHLSDDTKRFVVCKELCHALEMPHGNHTVTEQAIDDLVTAFSIFSAEEEDTDIDLHAFGVEILALATAAEITCPFPRRKRLIEKFGPHLDHDQVCSDYGIPAAFLGLFFRPRYMRAMETIYRRYELID